MRYALGIFLLLANLAVAQDSSNVTRLGQIGLWGPVSDVAASGQYNYLATMETGLRVVDTSDRT